MSITIREKIPTEIEESNFLGPLYSSSNQDPWRALNRPLDRPEVITECTCAFS